MSTSSMLSIIEFYVEDKIHVHVPVEATGVVPSTAGDVPQVQALLVALEFVLIPSQLGSMGALFMF